MTVMEYWGRKMPSYHNTMFLDGFKPWEIMEAKRIQMREALAD